MRRPSRRQKVLGLCYLPALYVALDFIARRLRGGYAV